MEEIFKPILDNDEELIRVFKPKKCVHYFKSFFATSLILLVFFLPILLALTLGVDEVTGEWIVPRNEVWLPIVIVSGIFVCLMLLQWILVHFSYKNIYYGYTNKRIIIRKGIIGVDYKSLDISMIGASTVNVNIIDKILRKNTGTINFGSMASPMITGNGVNNNYVFSSIENPYELYKEIKNFIADSSTIDAKTLNKVNGNTSGKKSTYKTANTTTSTNKTAKNSKESNTSSNKPVPKTKSSKAPSSKTTKKSKSVTSLAPDSKSKK